MNATIREISMTHAFRPTLASLAAIALIACGGDDNTADTAAVAEVRCMPAGEAPIVTASGVGPVRLGARVSAIADANCTMRDTSFTLGEGIMERGHVVELGEGNVVILVSGDTEPVVERIIVNDPAVRTEGGVGPGSTVENLRSSYGRICATVGEGNVVLSVPPLTGVSFGADVALSSLPRGGQGLDTNPGAVPGSAPISSLWIHGAASGCGSS
jgi:hypothetical protein